MDIHRCRFVQYPASAINSLAFTHSSLPALSIRRKEAQKNLQVRLAIGRANGDIEIWNPLQGAWHQELVIPGGEDRSVDGLVWVTDPDEEMADGKIIHGKSRLFSIGYTTAITEWDLEKARAKKHASGQHGDIWCLAVQPLQNRSAANANRKLVAGTVDGNLVLYSIEDNDLKFEKTLIRTPSKKVKFVSIAFQSRFVVVVGCSNGTICAYDIRNGTLLRQMSLGTDINGGSKNIIVWSVKCLPNGDIVSGDSTGQVCFWDGKTYTQAQRYQSHSQDVLCLAVSADGSKIVSGGMDRRTAFYELAGQTGRWTKLFHRRYHGHDVKAMASFEGKGMSVVVSGGSDSNPVVLPLRSAGKENHRTLSHLPQTLTLQSAPKARYIISWWENEVRLWHLLSPAQQIIDDPTAPLSLKKNRKFLAKIFVKGDSHISSAAISEDGTLLVAATASDIKVFQLGMTPGQESTQLLIKKVDLETSGYGATKVQISPDNQWITWVEEGSRVVTARVNTQDPEAYAMGRPSTLHRLRRQIPKNIALGGLGSYDRNITHLAYSQDSKMLAATDLAGYLDTWILRGPGEQTNGTAHADDDDEGSSDDESSDEDLEDASAIDGNRWVRNPKAALLPKMSSAPVVLSFSKTKLYEGDDYSLLVVTALKQLFVFNPLQGNLSEWSRRNNYPKFPEQFRNTRDLIKDVVWQGSRVWLYGAASLFMLDLSKEYELEPEKAKVKGTKRKRNGAHDSGAGGKMEKHASLAPQRLRTVTNGAEGPKWEDVDMVDADDSKSAGASSGVDDDDDEDVDGGELQRLRDSADGALIAAAAHGEVAEKVEKQAKWWHTYQFRPILGIVPLVGKETTTASGGLPPLEVALVERPLFLKDLPDRWLGENEHER
ncbi:WD40-repeat-containing domain protein [Podospora australis]|uniref:WD40-repeat-containing domain protein n=1 Tax=Podospora australis TaxID=1536484 RepID=A0AAN7ALT3_9PEZI|nr:WD40-repeat-containing domain protein [Podospora australis]